MPKKVWTIHVMGPMTRLRDGARVRVLEGTYTMMEAHPQHYEVSREGGLSFFLSLTELSHYVGAKCLTIDGDWP